jgi:hypothetical protein
MKSKAIGYRILPIKIFDFWGIYFGKLANRVHEKLTKTLFENF